MKLSVIISTYNSTEWLEKVFWGYSIQTFKDFELIIADDGSSSETKTLINTYKNSFQELKHVWHEDEGFRKCKILNKAIVEAQTEYLLFSDGDCIPRNDFVETHLKKRKKGHFLSGGYFKLPLALSQLIKQEDVKSQKCFDIKWLKAHGLKHSFKNNKLTAKGIKADLLNHLTPTKATWNGHDASGWKKDIIAVNGFDERMKYGGEDRELGERLVNNGIKGLQIRYSAVCIHLDHSRGYVNDTDLRYNESIRKTTKKERRVWTNFGIKPDNDFLLDNTKLNHV